MIRRQWGSQFLLITQHDHALLAGELAAHFGNARFATPDPAVATVRACALHDCGWPTHDDQPTLNESGLPTDVFETPLETALRIWHEGVERTASEDPYTQLLVSLHVLGLSGYAAAAGPKRTRHDEFDLNKFQHREIERQEKLRQQLGFSNDFPLYLGLAVRRDIPREEQLRRNHQILQTVDRISLGLCCDQVPFPKIDNVVPKTGAAPVNILLSRDQPTTIHVKPWPFDATELTLQLPGRLLDASAYESVEVFRARYDAAEKVQIKMTILP